MSKVENDFKLKVEQDKKIALNFKMKEKEITRLYNVSMWVEGYYSYITLGLGG
uniref:Uncharacterized protein n=1 Tax=Ciona intestinalis TaxID=7719 RepID=H2XJU3_CIOIN